MWCLIAGLALFLGTHAFSMWRGGRAAVIGRVGEGVYKIGYSVKSGIGLVLIVVGFGRWRAAVAAVLWHPPLWTHYITLVAMWGAFVALAAMGKQPGRIRGFLKHPMLVGIKLWALGHLLANGDVAGVALFGSFLAWAVVDRMAVKRRGDAGAARVARWTRADAVTVAAGSVAFGVMFALHRYLIGVPVYLG